jgi:hypothetical protein
MILTLHRLEYHKFLFSDVELSDVPWLQQVHKSRRTAEESRTMHKHVQGWTPFLPPLASSRVCYVISRY